jgi:hypothetical protein
VARGSDRSGSGQICGVRAECVQDAYIGCAVAVCREVGPCVVKALADWHLWVRIRGRQGLVFGMAVQEVCQVFQRLAGRVLQQPAGWFELHSLQAGAATDAEKDG